MATTTSLATSARRRSLVRPPLLTAALCAIIYCLTASYSSVSGDVLSTNVLSWQLATTQSAEFTASVHPGIDQHDARAIWVIQADDGRQVIGRSPGAVALGLPAYLVAGGADFRLDPGAVSAALLTAIAVLFLGLALRQHVRDKEIVLIMATFGLTTPVWSVAADGMWPHTVTVFGILGMAWSANQHRWFLVGLFGGVVLWGRLHAAVIVAVVGLYVAWRHREATIAARVASTSCGMLLLQCAWTRAIYGSWNPVTSYDTGHFEEYAVNHRIDPINHLGFWISPDRGLLVWTPVVVLLMPALVRSWRLLPYWSRGLVLGGFVYTVLQGTLNRFSGGDTFYGYRLTLELLACLAPALALSAARMGVAERVALGPILALQLVVLATGSTLGGLGSRAEEVWTRHSFFTPLASSPVALVALVVVCGVAGILAGRIWADPHASSSKQRGGRTSG